MVTIVEESPSCNAEMAIDQGSCSEMAINTHSPDFNTHSSDLVCAIYNSISHINSYHVPVEDLYCSAVEAVDEGLHTELVYNNV